MKPRVLLIAVVLLCSIARADETKPSSASPPIGEAQDVVFFGDQHPVFIRLHIMADGKGFETAWKDAMRRLHKYLDADGDGKLSAQERDKGGWLQRLRTQRPARRQPQPPRPAVPSADMSGVETVEDLTEFLRPSFGPFQIQTADRAEPGVESLFDHLDTDHDKKLSKSELEASDSSLRMLDSDDDEMIATRELVPYTNPYFGQQTRNAASANPADNAPFAVLSGGSSRIKMVRLLVARYDSGPEKDNKLSQSEIGLDQTAFEQADGDGDGALDSDELVHFLGRPSPNFELNVTTGKNVNATKVALADAHGAPTAMAPFLKKTGDGSLDLLLETIQVEFNPEGSRQNGVDVKSFYQNQFRQADGDNNKYLEMTEARRFGVFDDQTFKAMDRDGDGKLFLEEMDAYIDQDASVAQSRTLLTVVDHGRSFFDVLDVNRDRRLSIRELRAALKKVASWDRNGDGLISPEEIPAHIQAAFGPSQSTLLDRFNFSVSFNSGMGNGLGSVSVSPAWFTKMDHNKDGDLSPREFLGTRADFQRLDTDHDGLIDPDEASKAR